jgi:hypothetical protein
MGLTYWKYLLMLLLPFGVHAQETISKKDLAILHKKADSLKYYGGFILNGGKDTVRMSADSMFTKVLVRALKVKHSYHYAFDSAYTVMKLTSPDDNFKIFTWQVMVNENQYIQRGAIQLKTADGSLKLIPLFDRSSFTKKPEDSIRDYKNWIGALYYKVVRKELNGKPAYFLFGADKNNAKSDKKWIDVLQFDDAGMPRFGAPVFLVAGNKTPQCRFGIEYKKDAVVRLNYDNEMGLIVMDHLAPEEMGSTNKSTFIPDGEYEGFEWVNGVWKNIPKLFDYKAKPGDIPNVSDDAKGVTNDDIEKATEKNIRKEEKQKEASQLPKIPK